MTRGVGRALSLYLAMWLCLFPVLQAVHLAVADHDHHFSSEHHRIEDVPRGVERSAEDRATGTFRLTAPRTISTSVDLLLSFSLQDTVSRRHPTRVVIDSSHQDSALRPADHVASRSHLLVAPKTSPPCASIAG